MFLKPREASDWCVGGKREFTRSNWLKHGTNVKQVCVNQAEFISFVCFLLIFSEMVIFLIVIILQSLKLWHLQTRNCQRSCGSLNFKPSQIMFMSSVTFCAPSLQDGNGSIDEQELDALLKDLCDKNKMVPSLSIVLFRLLFWWPNIAAWDLACLQPMCVSVCFLPGCGFDRAGWVQGEHHGSVWRGEAVPHRAGDRPVSRLCSVTGLPETTPTMLPSLLTPDIIRCMCDP